MEKVKKLNWKQLGMDVLVDIVGGILIAIGVYNFASAAEFPMGRIIWNCINLLLFIWDTNRCGFNAFKYSDCNLLL